jgi:hypothetical protein
MKRTIVGVDIAKNVTQVHWVAPDSGEIVSKPVKRAAFLEYLVNRRPFVARMRRESADRPGSVGGALNVRAMPHRR